MGERGMLSSMTGSTTDETAAPASSEERPVGWWHRGHPVFAALTGFFTGLVFVVVVPGAYAAVLATVMDYEAAEELFPFVLVTLAVPIALLVPPVTRRFARYMLLGIVSTALVVGGVAALVLWLLVSRG